MRDLKIIILLGIVAFLLLIVTDVIFFPVSAAIGDVVTIPNAIAAPSSSNCSSIEVHQGSPEQPEVIYHGETVDLTLVEGWYGIVMRYPGGELVDVSSFSHHILVDPKVFPAGMWYQRSPEGIYARGNNIAFKVSAGTRPNPQQIYIDNTTLITGISPIIHENLENLPLASIPVGDYLVAHSDPLAVFANKTLDDNRTALVWIFQNGPGGRDWIHPKFGNSTVNYTISEIQQLVPGNYSVLVQYTGSNKIADITYANFSRERVGYGYDDVIYSPFGGTNTTVSGWTPTMIRDEVISKLNKGMWIKQGGSEYNVFDDSYEIRNLTVEDPYSDIILIDEYMRAEDPANASIVRVGGYTNLAKGTLLNIVLDNDKQNPRTLTFVRQNTTAVGDKIGDRRQFLILYSVYYKELEGAGKSHSFTVVNPDGSYTTANYNAYDMPAGQVKPLQTIRYIGRNEFLPTLTPPPAEIVTVTVTVPVPVPVVREVVKTIEVTPWYFTSPWVVVWAIIIVVIYYLWWRLKK